MCASLCISQSIDSLPSQFSQHITNVLNFLLAVGIEAHFAQALSFLWLSSCLMAFSSEDHFICCSLGRREGQISSRGDLESMLFSQEQLVPCGCLTLVGLLPGGEPKGDLTLGLWRATLGSKCSSYWEWRVSPPWMLASLKYSRLSLFESQV